MTGLRGVIKSQKEIVLTEDRVNEIVHTIAQANITERKARKRHVEHVQTAKSQQDSTGGKKCSMCGGRMVIRESQYGRFLGCSNYPNCKHKEDIPH